MRHRDEIANWRHELRTQINCVIGLTEIQIDEATEAELSDYGPALREINSCGRALLATVDANESGPCLSDRGCWDNLESEVTPALDQARQLAATLRTRDRHAAAQEIELVSSALVRFVSMARNGV